MVFNSFQVNTYILYDETKECIIIDPACYTEDENRRLENFISEKQLTPVIHLNTHCHVDHVLGMHFTRHRYNIPSYAHKLELDLLNNAPVMGDLFGFVIEPLPGFDKYIFHNEDIVFGNSVLHAIHVPGHSPGSLSYYSEANSFVITGDTLFSGSIGRTDLPGGNYNTLINSIITGLFSLPGNTTVWPGHGEATNIKNEVENNPFFNDYKT